MKHFFSIKKAAIILFAALIIPSVLTGCGEKTNTSEEGASVQQTSVDPELQKLMEDAIILSTACKDVYNGVFDGTINTSNPGAIDPSKLPDPNAGEKTRRDIAFKLTVSDVIANNGLSAITPEIPDFVVDYRSGRIYAKDEEEAKNRGLDTFTVDSTLGWILFGEEPKS